MLAAAAHLPERLEVVGCAYGTGCDGELTVAEVLGRVAVLGREDNWLGTISPGAEAARETSRSPATSRPRRACWPPAARSARAGRRRSAAAGGRSSSVRSERSASSSMPAPAIGAAAPLADLVASADSIEDGTSGDGRATASAPSSTTSASGVAESKRLRPRGNRGTARCAAHRLPARMERNRTNRTRSSRRRRHLRCSPAPDIARDSGRPPRSRPRARRTGPSSGPSTSPTRAVRTRRPRTRCTPTTGRCGSAPTCSRPTST